MSEDKWRWDAATQRPSGTSARSADLKESRRPSLVANRATVPQKWPPPSRNVADSCELTATTKQQMSDEKWRWDAATRRPPGTSDTDPGRDNFENDRDEHDVEPFMLVEGCYLISALAVTDQVPI